LRYPQTHPSRRWSKEKTFENTSGSLTNAHSDENIAYFSCKYVDYVYPHLEFSNAFLEDISNV
jgi:hypothetical protein